MSSLINSPTLYIKSRLMSEPLTEADVRAFAISKAFQSGVSLEQILSACHWKSHNTFTQFYLKDVAWADSELLPSGPCGGCSANPPAVQSIEEICTYVNSCTFVYIVHLLKKLKTPQKTDMLPSGGLFLWD